MAETSGQKSVPECSHDAELVRAAQRGDRASFGKLYDRYARMVHGLLLSKVPYSEAEDLTQEVFFKALRQLGSLRDIAKFGGWLAAIARNLANDHYGERCLKKRSSMIRLGARSILQALRPTLNSAANECSR